MKILEEGYLFVFLLILAIREGHSSTGCACLPPGTAVQRNRNTAMTFNRQSTADYVRYHPRFPQMKEVTTCLWIHPTRLTGQGLFCVFSYWSSSSDNTFLLCIKNRKAIDIYVNGDKHEFAADLKLNRYNHVCVTFSQPRSRVTLYLDGRFRDDEPYSGSIIRGGGVLIFGQDQDRKGGGFDANQMFRGVVTNFKMWPRVLSSTEIRQVAAECKYPLDVIVEATLQNIEWFGEVSVFHPTTCPTV